MRLLAHPARPWHLDGDRAKDNVSKNVRLARLHEVAQGKAAERIYASLVKHRVTWPEWASQMTFAKTSVSYRWMQCAS
jgi:hypothetical protein